VLVLTLVLVGVVDFAVVDIFDTTVFERGGWGTRLDIYIYIKEIYIFNIKN
jgi:hypothetical protein